MLGLGLTALVGYLLLAVLIPSLRVTAEVQKRSDLRQHALVASRWLENDLQEAAPAAIGLRSNPAILAVQPLEALAVDGSAVWDEKLVVYLHTQRELRRGEWDSTSTPGLSLTLQTGRPTRTPQDDLQQLFSGFTRTKVVAKYLNSLTITHGGLGDAVTVPIIFDFEFKSDAQSVDFYRFQKVISPRMGE